MIRAFITTWELVGNHIQNPIVEQGEAIVSGQFTCSMFYPDADVDGIPDGTHVLILVKGANPTIEDLAALPEVKMLPKYRFSKPVSEIPTGVKQVIKDYVVARGIAPSSVFDGVEVYGDFLKKLVKSFQVGFKGFGRCETEYDEDFG